MIGVTGSDADGRPHALRLSEGLAVRAGDGYRYLCPALFDSEETPRVAALPDGQLLVASASALYVVSEDWEIATHPYSASGGVVRGLEATEDGAVALRAGEQADQLELLRLDARGGQVLAQLPAALVSLAAERDRVLVAGLQRDGRVSQRGFRLEGSELPEWHVDAPGAPPDAVAAQARVAGGQPYVLVLAGDGPISELVQLQVDDDYRPVQRASVSLSGPVASDGEHVWIAFDGELGELRDGVVTPRVTDAPVTCVLRGGEQAYACVGTELRLLSADGVGARAFGLDELIPPDVDALEPALAERCTLQWLRFRVDLSAAGVELREDAGTGGVDAGDEADAGRDAARGGGGCMLRGAPATNRAGTDALASWMLLAWLSVRRRVRGRAK